MLERPEPGLTTNVRLRRFFHAAASSYAHLAVNILYVLGSVPLALHFLQKREFGLWALCMQLGGYLQLIDFGMSASVSRHLIDYKDARDGGEYGGLIRTGALVLLVQGFLVLVGGSLLILVGTRVLQIDPDLERPFQIIMLVQCALTAADFPARLFGHVLAAHQRIDLVNYSQIGLFFISYGVLWYAFAHGVGVFSLIWASVVTWVGVVVSNSIACLALNILPSRGRWGSASWSKFRDLFSYGKDVFWIALGVQMINASQAIVVTRVIGLDAAAIWSVCTRTYTVANQFVWRPFDSSSTMLSEMIARNEKSQLLHRFKGLVILTTSLGVLVGVMFAVCNQPFVTLWTHGRIGWGRENDVLLAVWLIVLAFVHCHSSIPVFTKRIGFMRYIYFIEGVIFLAIGSYAASRVGFPGLLATSIVATLLFTFSYGIWRTMREFNLPLTEVLFRWPIPSARLLVIFGATAVFLFWRTRNFSAPAQLMMYVPILGCIGTFLFLRIGIGADLREELRKRAPNRLVSLLERFFIL